MTSRIGNDFCGDFLGNVPAEQRAEQTVLRLDVIIKRLDPEKGLDTGKELLPVKWFGQEVVGACFDAADPMGHIMKSR